MFKLCLCLGLLAVVAAQKKKMILNVDGSVEDAKAVLLALDSPDTDVVGIICTASFISPQQCVKNMDRIRRLTDNKDAKLYLGSSSSLLAGQKEDFSPSMGSDAFGEYPTMDPSEKANPDVQEESGAIAMARLAREHKDDGVVVVATGPLTDVAMALRIDPSFGTNIKAIYILGGNMFGVGVVAGSPAAEYNFYSDPEAAYVVLGDMKAPVILIPHETVHQRDNNEMYDLFNVAVKKDAFLRANSTKANFIREVSASVIKELQRIGRPYTFGDEIAVAAAIRPSSVIDRIKPIAATVELFGQHTRGQVAIDWLNKDLSKINVRVVTEYSPRAVSSMMLKAVASDRSEGLDSALFR